jgi:hypothetical protein
VTRTASASWFMPLSSARRAVSSNAIIFAMSGFLRMGRLEVSYRVPGSCR